MLIFFDRSPPLFPPFSLLSQVLYKRMRDYIDLDDRLETINVRYTVLQDLLGIARSVQEAKHSVRLEWVVIWLILIEVVIGVATILLGQH